MGIKETSMGVKEGTLVGTLELKEKKDLLKHVSAIHSAAPLTLLQRKINNALLFHAYPSLTKQEDHTITITELCRMIHYEGHNYDALKGAILGLLNTVIQWNVIGDNCNDEVWRAGAIISFVEIKGSTCTYYYSKPLRELLYEPSVYGRISMIVQSRFTSVYGLALYENCVRYITVGLTKWFDYQTFRKLMGVVDDTKYAVFKDFKKRVIDRAISEVNLRSSVEVTPEYKRAGRKVVSIRFKVNEKGKKAPLGLRTSKTYNELELNEREFIDGLKNDFNLSPSHSVKMLREYGQDYITKKINILKKTGAYKAGQIQGPAYLISLLKNDAQESTAIERVGDLIDKRNQESNELENKQHDLEAKKRQDYYKYLVKKTDESFDALNQEERQEILDQFVKSQEDKSASFILQEYRKHGLSSAMVKNVFSRYMRESHSEKIGDLVSESEFLDCEEIS